MPSYLKVVINATKAETSDGKIIPCDYLDHPRYSLDCNFAIGLHYVFIRFSSDRSYSKGYELRTAIKALLDYAVEYEQQNPMTLHLTSLSQISPEVFLGYDMFIKRNRGPKGLATRMKTALYMVAKNHDEGMPLLALPLLDDIPSKAHEPLTEDCFNQLSEALRSHIDYLYEMIAFRRAVDESEPYATLDEIITDSKPLTAWVPDNARSLKTLILNDHPFIVPHDEFVTTSRKVRSGTSKFSPANIVEAIYARYNNPFFSGKQSRNVEKQIEISDLFHLYYPSALDQAAITLFLQIQTGWNKETVMAIDGDAFEHALTGALTTNQTLITSEKNKSQSTNKPYLTPKTFFAPSSKEDKYSAYNLVLLAKALSAPFVSLACECMATVATEGHNPLFMCMREYSAMCATTSVHGCRPGRYLSVNTMRVWGGGVENFLKKYEIREHGKRLTTVGELSGRLRPTWIRFMRDKRDRPLSVVALQQGHNSIETTDVHYDSSGPAMQLRRQRLKTELDSVVKLIREKKFKGLIGRRNDKSVDIASLRIFTIPSHEKSLWACRDSFKPDWPGSSSRIAVGERCSEIAQCLFCSCVCIFEDSLPYLMNRQVIIQRQLEGYQESAFDSPMSDELKVIEYILEEWGDERALKEAARYLRKFPELLPSDMHLLSILFEDE